MSFLGERWPVGWRLAWPGDDVGHLYKGCAHKTPLGRRFSPFIISHATIVAFSVVHRSRARETFAFPQLPASGRPKKIKAGNLDAAFNAAWSMFHDSFDDNQDKVLDAMHDSFFKGVQYITPMNMSSTVTLFKELGREVQAGEMLKYYVEARGAEKQLFNLKYPFADRVADPDVIKAFKEKFETFKQETTPTEILLRIADTHSWNPEDITALSTLSVDEYCKMLKATNGLELRKLISACLMFDSMMGATPDYQEIPKRAREALKRIGEESPINAQRVKAYGVKLDSATPKD